MFKNRPWCIIGSTLETLRNLFRRKLRSVLTLFGIVIGIFALIVMGSMAEKMNVMMDGGAKYVTGQISIAPKGTSMFSGEGGILKYDVITKLKKIKGVKNISMAVSFIYSEEGQSNVSFGMPETVTGWDMDSKFVNRNYKTLKMQSGRMLRKGDRNVCNIGIDIAKSKNKKVGDYLKIRNKKFKVIGVFEKTLTGPDKMIGINIKDAQPLYVNSNPMLKSIKEESKKALRIDKKTLQFMDKKMRKRINEARSFKQDEIITGASVEWNEGVNTEKLSKTIEKKIADVEAVSPAEGKKVFEQASLIINAIILGSTIIALIVGGLAVLNTMFMAVNERIREIGLKKAIGAKTKHIMREILAEAVVISIFGSLIGLALGYGAVTAVNSYTAHTGTEIFQTTGRLVVFSISFAVFLGLTGGFYPALRAARLEPLKALRDEK